MNFDGQHRLRRVQLVNWGTFNGAFDLAVPRSGLLVTGPSGSGKSSLLDALAAVLVHPKWLQFNAAAQEGGVTDRARSLLSYVRGAHKREADAESGEVATAYLRPGATWSGIALTFDDGDGRLTTLIRLFHLARGANAVTDVSSLFVLADEAVELLTLAPFAQNGLQQRQLKAAHPTWPVAPTYPPFAARLQRRLGLASDQAQRLLHKTQSAKSLTSLDTLLREFMLDAPDTFELVQQAIAQFQELAAAHSSVVDARRQVETLHPLQQIAVEHGELESRQAVLAEEQLHLDAVRLHLQLQRSAAQEQQLADTLTGLEIEVQRADAALAERRRDRDTAKSAVDGLGGQELTALERDADDQAQRLERVTRQRARAEQLASGCGLTLPDTAAEWSAFQATVSARLAELAETTEQKERRYSLSGAHADAQQQLRRLQADLDSLNRQGSTIEPGLLALRDDLLRSTRVPRERLPFAGELLAVHAEHAEWTGAIERVLYSFARTLLVPDDLYPHVSELIEQRHLGLRLRYDRVPSSYREAGTPSDSRSLTLRLDVVDCEFAGWLRATVATRFDYACVGSVAELRAVQRGVTRTGQVRHSATRHEKDDRTKVDDRRFWALGSSTDAKRDALQTAIAEAQEAEQGARNQRDHAEQRRDARQQQAAELDQLASMEWPELDRAGVALQLEQTRARAARLRATNADLAAALNAFEVAESAVRQAEKLQRSLLEEQSGVRHRWSALTERRARWSEELTPLPPVPPATHAALTTRFAEASDEPDVAARAIAHDLASAAQKVTARLEQNHRRTERIMQDYKQNWPARAADLAIQADFLPDYLTILEALRADRLPEFEDRFFDLLQSQSRNNIGAIAQVLNNSRREIRERVDPINASLLRTEFAPGRHLHVRVDDRRLPEVTEFLRTLAEITSGSLEDALGSDLSSEARTAAEQRFVVLRDLLTRLASSEPINQRWRNQCLDTRLHVQFVAEVRDGDGRVVDLYTGAGGLSGGERQKLVVFCLAAALRYQLARDGDDQPNYGLVVLDEAFDKTDPAFTRAGLDVFRSFGFQLVLATPLKMLQTLEDYVGGAAVVLNEPGVGSRFEVMLFEDAEQTQRIPSDGARVDSTEPSGSHLSATQPTLGEPSDAQPTLSEPSDAQRPPGQPTLDGHQENLV
ncbi:ATP-binding protein [Micropruina sp.]|uniref:ATP-binding protein n=1 Tax=Micropruina sp. TaxID=2737536 RepID=UPI0039E2F95F